MQIRLLIDEDAGTHAVAHNLRLRTLDVVTVSTHANVSQDKEGLTAPDCEHFQNLNPEKHLPINLTSSFLAEMASGMSY